MRKFAFILSILLILAIPLEASATSRATNIAPTLSYSGVTANCTVNVGGSNLSDHIEVTMKLMFGSVCLASWTADGYGYLYMNETATVTKGRTYKLVVDVTINGVLYDSVYVKAAC